MAYDAHGRVHDRNPEHGRGYLVVARENIAGEVTSPVELSAR